MTAVAIPLDLGRLRDAVERLDLPDIDLRSIDRPDLDTLRRDLSRRVSDTGLQGNLQRLVEEVDLVDRLPDLDGLLGRRRVVAGALAVSRGSLLTGSLALLGGLALGGLLAFFLHPAKGPRRRRAAFRRAGRVKRRLLG